ncbi:MAG: hypothetical protein U0457_00245 [Candidatus Sericytochromatia bacterium]
MSSKIYKLKQKVVESLPEGELPTTIFGRLMVKTKMIWSKIDEKTEVTEEQYNLAVKAVEDLLGKKLG